VIGVFGLPTYLKGFFAIVFYYLPTFCVHGESICLAR
jgi:hypothetical protein